MHACASAARRLVACGSYVETTRLSNAASPLLDTCGEAVRAVTPTPGGVVRMTVTPLGSQVSDAVTFSVMVRLVFGGAVGSSSTGIVRSTLENGLSSGTLTGAPILTPTL